jgi:hypothetical protein
MQAYSRVVLGGFSKVKQTSSPTSFLRKYSRASHAYGSSFVSFPLSKQSSLEQVLRIQALILK